MLRKILGKDFITKKCTQCTPHVLKMDILELPGNKNIGKLFSKYKLLFPNQASSSSDPSQILILQHPIPMSFLPPSPSLANFSLDNWKTLLNNPHHALLWIPYLFLPYSTIRHNYWIYKSIYKDKPTKSITMHLQIIKPYIGQTNICQNAESLRAASLSKLVNSNSIFVTMCADFSTKW